MPGCGCRPNCEDVLVAADADDPVTVEGRKALVREERIHHVVVVWFEQNPDEDLQGLACAGCEVAMSW